jgi:hypothetical protein
LAVEDTVSPRVLAKIVYSGASAASFVEASNHLAELANIEIHSERVRRACGRVADDRIEHHQRLQEAYQNKSLPEQAWIFIIAIPLKVCVVAVCRAGTLGDCFTPSGGAVRHYAN